MTIDQMPDDQMAVDLMNYWPNASCSNAIWSNDCWPMAVGRSQQGSLNYWPNSCWPNERFTTDPTPWFQNAFRPNVFRPKDSGPFLSWLETRVKWDYFVDQMQILSIQMEISFPGSRARSKLIRDRRNKLACFSLLSTSKFFDTLTIVSIITYNAFT